ncbi:MAG: ferric reductase-like transmembrane domain-containing protein, partial [Actinomycetota bacterium]|nr:ferric reductase-like transmembrane domain-containing protein [Actinomycetota bacterium]
MRRQLERTLWATAFLAVLLGPALLAPLLHAGAPPARPAGDGSSLLSQLSVGMGLLATSMLVCAVVLPSRVRSLTRTFGIDGVLGIHRFVGLAVVLLVGLHIVLVVVAKPANLALFDVFHAPNRARAAVGATVAMGALIGLTVLRRRLRHRYEVWRWVHLTLAGTTLALSALHIWWLNHLIRDTSMRAVFVVLALGVLVVLAYR